MYLPVYNPAQDISSFQLPHLASDLGTPITIGEGQNLSVNLTHGQINLSRQLTSIPENLSDKKLLNPWMQVDQKFDRIDSVSTDIRIGPVKSKLEINAQNLKTQVTLFSESGFTLKMKGQLRSKDREVNFEPVFYFTKAPFSLEADLHNLSAQLKFPVPGVLSDQLQLQIKTNLPEFMVDGEYLQGEVKSTFSLRYRIAIDDATKLEFQNSYNLHTSNYRALIKLTLQ